MLVWIILRSEYPECQGASELFGASDHDHDRQLTTLATANS
jgi:hypothetical protein